MKYLKKFNEDFAILNNAEEMEGIDSPKECEKCSKPHDFCECETAQHGGEACEACEGCGHEECVCEYEHHSEGRIGKFDEKMNAGLRAYLDKKAGKKGKKDDDKKSDNKDDKKSDKKDDKKSDKKDDKEETLPKGKGLTVGQKKLPIGLQKAILAKKK